MQDKSSSTPQNTQEIITIASIIDSIKDLSEAINEEIKIDNATNTGGEGGDDSTGDRREISQHASDESGKDVDRSTVDQKDRSQQAVDDKIEQSSKESEPNSICNVLPKWVLSCGTGKKEPDGDDKIEQSSKESEPNSVCNVLPKWVLSCGTGKKEHDGDDSSRGEVKLSPKDKLDLNIDQMRDALNKLQKYETELQQKIKRAKQTSIDAMKKRRAAQLSGAGSSSSGALEGEDRILQELVKEIRKLRHQIPTLHKSSFKDSGAHDRDSESSIDGVRTNMEIYNRPSMQMSKSLKQSFVFTEIKQIYEGLETQNKECLLCFAVFPENEELKKRTLTYWWEGEDLLPQPKDGGTIEKVARGLLEDFVNKGLIEPIKKKRGKKTRSYRMNPIVHGVVVKIAEDKNFFVYDDKGNPTSIFQKKDEKNDEKTELCGKLRKLRHQIPTLHKSSFKDSSAHDRDSKKICTKACLLKAEKVTATPQPQEKKGNGEKKNGNKDTKGKEKKNGNKDTKGKEKKNGNNDTKGEEKKGNGEKKNGNKDIPDFTVEKEVETVFNFNEPFPDLRMESFAKKKEADVAEWLSKMEKLKVLHLGRWQASVKHHIEVEKTDFLEGLKNLRNLRLFSLQGVSRIDELTRSIMGLTNLKILDLKACHNLEVLPKEISYLKNLTHLDVSDCYLIDHMPKGLSHLTNLLVLKGFVVGDEQSQRTRKYCSLEGLGGMQKLRELSLNISTIDFPSREQLKALEKLESLKKLTMSWGADLNPGRSPPKPATPKPAKDEPHLPSGLVKLDLLCFPKVESPNWLEPITLKNLLKLYIRGGHFGGLKKNQKWESVKILRLKFLTEVKMSWEELQVEFPNLWCLEKVGCPRITFCPCDDNGVWVKPHEESEGQMTNQSEKPKKPEQSAQPPEATQSEETKDQAKAKQSQQPTKPEQSKQPKKAKQSEEVEDKAQAKPAEQPKKLEQSAQPEKAKEPEKKKQTEEPKKPEQKSEKTKQSEDAKKSEQSKSESEQPKKPKQSEEAENAKKSEQSEKSEQSKS